MKPEQRIIHYISSVDNLDKTGLISKDIDQDKKELLQVQIRIPMQLGWIERVELSVEADGKRNVFGIPHLKNEGDYAYFQKTIHLETRALYHYYFSFVANGQLYYYKKYGNENPYSVSVEEMWKLAIGFQVPAWAKGAIMYHIFVDRYRKGFKGKLSVINNRKLHSSWKEPPVIGPDKDGQWNVDFYGGDLTGITDTLKYLKSLGVTILYLSPIVYAISNHRYDTRNYLAIDPYVGTEKDIKKLCREAHKRGMYVILDAVYNHTGNDSIYFNEFGYFHTVGAYQSKESPFYSWYRKHYSNGEEKFDYWWGMKNLPVCDPYSKDWQNYILAPGGVIDNWFSWGIDGLRLDVADDLPDFFIEGIHAAVKRNKKDGFILGEVWKNPMRMNRTYLSSGKAMHSVMNYQLVDALFRYFKNKDAETLQYKCKEIKTEYPEETIYSLMNFTSTHDISRVIEFFGGNYFRADGEWIWNLEDESVDWAKSHSITREEYLLGKQRLKSYYAAITFLPGIVSIFYGDEVGMTGIGNLANRGPYPWKNRDKDLLNYFRKMGKLRQKFSFLKTAEFQEIEISKEQFCFERIGENGERIFVVLNNLEKESIEISIPERYLDATVLYQKGIKLNCLQAGGILVLHSKKRR